MEIELGPCPFCGGTARLSSRQLKFIGYRDNRHQGGGSREHIVDMGYQVICNSCRARGPLEVVHGWTKEEMERITPGQAYLAMHKWNIRKDGDRTVLVGTHYVGADCL